MNLGCVVSLSMGNFELRRLIEGILLDCFYELLDTACRQQLTLANHRLDIGNDMTSKKKSLPPACMPCPYRNGIPCQNGMAGGIWGFGMRSTVLIAGPKPVAFIELNHISGRHALLKQEEMHATPLLDTVHVICPHPQASRVFEIF